MLKQQVLFSRLESNSVSPSNPVLRHRHVDQSVRSGPYLHFSTRYATPLLPGFVDREIRLQVYHGHIIDLSSDFPAVKSVKMDMG